jgi:hypothetical protein
LKAALYQRAYQASKTKYAQMTMILLLTFNMAAVKPKSVIGSYSTQVRPKCELGITAAGLQLRKLAKNLVDPAPKAYPWFAKGIGCGAALVTPDLVITTEHCNSDRF